MRLCSRKSGPTEHGDRSDHPDESLASSQGPAMHMRTGHLDLLGRSRISSRRRPSAAYVRRNAYDGVTSRINATRGRNETEQARL